MRRGRGRLPSRRGSSGAAELHQWEEHEDPNGVTLPRFKRHDDKTIAVITP